MRSLKVMRAGTGNKNFFIWPKCTILTPKRPGKVFYFPKHLSKSIDRKTIAELGI